MVPGKSNKITMGYLEDHSWPFNLWADILNSPQCAQTAEKDTEQTAAVLYWPNLDNVPTAALDDRQQKVIRMRYERGMTLVMIGDALGCSQERVRQIILRSLRRLREPQYFQRLTAIPESEVLQLRVKVHELVRQQEDLKKQIHRSLVFSERREPKRLRGALSYHLILLLMLLESLSGAGTA